MTQTLDVRVDTGWQRHPKTKELKAELGLEGPWALLALWCFARHYHPDGSLIGKADNYIEDAADWKGNPGALISALVRVRYMDGGANARTLHDWTEHESWAVGTDERQYNGRIAALIKHGRTREQAEKVLKRQKKTPVRPAVRTGMRGGMRNGCAPDSGMAALRSAPLLTLPYSSSPNQQPPTPFDVFYAEYPRKVGKANAAKAWNKIKPDEVAQQRILAAITVQRASDQWSKDGGKFIPHPASWLNGRRWEDETPKANGSTGDPYMDSMFARAGVAT